MHSESQHESWFDAFLCLSGGIAELFVIFMELNVPGICTDTFLSAGESCGIGKTYISSP